MNNHKPSDATYLTTNEISSYQYHNRKEYWFLFFETVAKMVMHLLLCDLRLDKMEFWNRITQMFKPFW